MCVCVSESVRESEWDTDVEKHRETHGGVALDEEDNAYIQDILLWF